ncbi:MAG TPA: hypothetical protein VHU18_08430 [Rhizomicrobium sp.]|jgi:hypothetical protein|nr:hypothetical protein [Rhizomicrobium sp.]
MQLRLICVLAAVLAFQSGTASAQFVMNGQRQASQCVLQYTAGTRSKIAVQLIRSACNDIYHPLGLSTASPKTYDNCLLEYLSDAQSDAAALQIQAACANLYPRFGFIR